MQELFVEGGNRLCGELTIQGSKNGVLPVLAATIVCAGECRIENCPHLSDVDASIAILRHLGCCTRWAVRRGSSSATATSWSRVTL